MRKATQSGFTLLEMIVGITVLGVLVGIGIPSFRETIRNNRTIGRTNELMGGLILTRASTDGGRVATICAGNSGLTACSGGTDWSYGWLIFEDKETGTIGAYSSTDGDVMLDKSPLVDQTRVTITGNVSSVTFDPGGVRGGTAASFTLKNSACTSGLNKRQVNVSAPGIGKISFLKQNCP